MKYSHYDDNIKNTIPTTTIDVMTPILGSYTPAFAPAFDIWEETKYIVNQDPIFSSNPYLKQTTTSPFFEFTDMVYQDSSNNDIRVKCPIIYTLSSTQFIKTLVSGNEGIDGTYRVTLLDPVEVVGTYEVVVKGTALGNPTKPFSIKFILNL